MNVIKHLLSEDDYKETKKILYEIRRNKPFKAYEFFKKIVFISAYFGGRGPYIPYTVILQRIKVWYNKDTSYEDYESMGELVRRGEQPSFFGIKCSFILNESMTAVMDRTILIVRNLETYGEKDFIGLIEKGKGNNNEE